MTLNKSLLLLLSLTTLLGACDMKNNLDEMHDSTVEMNRTTKEMNDRTTGLETATGELYDALRQGDTLSARRSAFENLVNATDPARKLSEAAKYFMSFEYQLWSDQGQDREINKREDLATLAAREFFKDVQQFIPGGVMAPKPFAGQIIPTKKSNLINSLNALSVTTHYLNPKQEAHLKEKKAMTSLSMSKMIEESLFAKAKIESGAKHLTDYPGYVAEVLANESTAIYLLEARYNYLLALFLGRSTNIAYSKLGGAKIVAMKWTLDLSPFNYAQVEELGMFLTAALKTKNLLILIGIKARTDMLLVRMFNNMKLMTSIKATSTEKATKEQEIGINLTELKKF
jgi:hypothetical protein